ncbi:hypothetical protein FGLOB1_11629 [Fusarium globosum]|uniref:Uncharacterized protein n=1 Tax=Fusarium globosum TaxID=78864 RepID=A0A8H6D0N7_9HYPO|nr:hypothetical protein FGLOB1_11629 [Fusarium globosum]
MFHLVDPRTFFNTISEEMKKLARDLCTWGEKTKGAVIALTGIAASGGIADGTKLSLLEVAGKMKKTVDELGGFIADPQAVADDVGAGPAEALHEAAPVSVSSDASVAVSEEGNGSQDGDASSDRCGNEDWEILN